MDHGLGVFMIQVAQAKDADDPFRAENSATQAV
jgi:hypothetical protein